MAISNNERWVSPSTRRADLPVTLSFDKKTQIFSERVRGWQLDIAAGLEQSLQHSGFGVLYIILSYFEMIGRYRRGSIDRVKAGRWFRRGFADFARFVGFDSDPNYAIVRRLLYEGARCGLFHVGMTTSGVYIDGSQSTTFVYDAGPRRLVIDPKRLVDQIQAHFSQYISDLGDTNNVQLRGAFETKFNNDILPQMY